MKIMNTLERWIRPFVIPNLVVGIIGLQVVIYVVSAVKPEVIETCQLVPQNVWNGEVWRLVSFMFTPPFGMGLNPAALINTIWALIFWSIFHLCGTNVEHAWGTVRLNLFFFIGYLANVTVSMFVTGQMTDSTFFYSSLFLAFAYLYPDVEFRLYFLLPVKVKWLALLQLAGSVWVLLVGNAMMRWTVVASLANLAIFIGPGLLQRLKQKGRKAAWERDIRKTADVRHECHLCQRTNVSDPKLDFRYCSKCDGSLCYCEDHIREHEHVSADSQSPSG